MKNVRQCYNVYLNIPESISDYFYFKISVYRNSQFVYQYDSHEIPNNQSKQFYYNFSLFNGKTWKPINEDGLISKKIFSKIAIKNTNDKENNYLYRYSFYNFDDDQNKVILLQQQLVVAAQVKNNQQLNFRIAIPQLITTNHPILYCKTVSDLDEQDIVYEIQLYDCDKQVLLSTYRVNPNDGQQFVCCQISDIYLSGQSIYKWRIRAIDQFGLSLYNRGVIQTSQWSQFYFFKVINLLTFNVVVQQHFFQNLFQFINIKDNDSILNYRVFVQGLVFSQFFQSLYIKDSHQILKFRVRCFNDLFSILNFASYVLQPFQILKLRVFVRVLLDKFLLNNFVYVKDTSVKLGFRIDVPLLLHFIVFVPNFFGIDPNNDQGKLFLGIQVRQYKDIDFGVQVRRNYYSSLFFNLRIRPPYVEPFVIDIYDSNNNLITMDNRIQTYDYNGNKLFLYDENLVVLNAYPYLQSGTNNKLVAYDYFGQLIQNIYDSQGNLIEVYDQSNKIKQWRNVGTYYAKYTYYNNNVVYRYNFSLNKNADLDSETKKSSLILQANNSGQWSISIIPYYSTQPLINGAKTEFLYINEPPKICEQPFFIDGNYLTEDVIINNSMPTFSFNPVSNNDNDIIRYHLMISKDRYFETTNVDVYLNQSASIISYTLKQDQKLQQQGIYYIYLATCDYSGQQIKTQLRTKQLFFKYQFCYSTVYNKCQVVNYDWKLIKPFSIIVRGWSKQSYKILVQRWAHTLQGWDQNDLNQLIRISNFLTEEQLQANKLSFNIQVFYIGNSDLNLGIIVPKLIWDLDMNLLVYQFIERDQDNLNQMLQICYSTENQKHLTEQQKIRLEKQLNIGFQLKTCYRQMDSLPLIKFSSVVMNHIFDKSPNLNFKLQVWNAYIHPTKNRSNLYMSMAVSNFVSNFDCVLQHRLIVKYPQPPSVIIHSNITQNVWQDNYSAWFEFQLKEQPILSIKRYQYVFSSSPTLNYWHGYKQVYGNYIKIDLRDVLFQLNGKYTGICYLHVKTVNIKDVKSSETAVYCVRYNNGIQSPSIQYINGQYVAGNQKPTINFNVGASITWTSVYDSTDYDQITYYLQVSKDHLFSDIVFEKSDISSIGDTGTGYFTYTLTPKTLSPGDYYCRVRAFDQNQYSQWSLLARFFVNKSPQPPTNLRVRNL